MNLADQLQGQNIGWHSDNGSSIALCAYSCALVFAASTWLTSTKSTITRISKIVQSRSGSISLR
jgi:hypothetical protein